MKKGKNGSSLVARAGESSNNRREVFCFGRMFQPALLISFYVGNFDVRRKLYEGSNFRIYRFETFVTFQNFEVKIHHGFQIGL
jgi:hypothetical protein